MAMYAWCLLLALCLSSVNYRSFVDSASLGKSQDSSSENSPMQDANVRELENLKHSLDKTLALIKTHITDSNGQQKTQEDTAAEWDADGKPAVRLNQHSEDGGKPDGQRESPSTDNGNRRSTALDSARQDVNDNLNKYSWYSGVQYSPLDMAEYILWTGDEKGVTMVIEEFLQEGLMSREEAITFLQEIKYNLEYLQTHYSNQGLHVQDKTKVKSNIMEKIMGPSKFLNDPKQEENRPPYDLIDLRQNRNKKRNGNQDPLDEDIDNIKQNTEDEDYEELLEKLRVADFLYTEYSLEEVIYQLSKIMFAQSLNRGSAEAQAALQKFTNFLETEAEEGHISRALEKKVLDVLIAALTDTLTDHPELVPAAREGLGGGMQALPDGNRLLRKLLEMGQLDKEAVKAILAPYKIQQSEMLNQEHHRQINENPLLKTSPMGLGKYKTP